MGGRRLEDEPDHLAPLEAQRAGGRREARGEARAQGAVGSEAALAPQHGGAEHPFRWIRGRLHAFVRRKPPVSCATTAWTRGPSWLCATSGEAPPRPPRPAAATAHLQHLVLGHVWPDRRRRRDPVTHHARLLEIRAPATAARRHAVRHDLVDVLDRQQGPRLALVPRLPARLLATGLGATRACLVRRGRGRRTRGVPRTPPGSPLQFLDASAAPCSPEPPSPAPSHAGANHRFAASGRRPGLGGPRASDHCRIVVPRRPHRPRPAISPAPGRKVVDRLGGNG